MKFSSIVSLFALPLALASPTVSIEEENILEERAHACRPLGISAARATQVKNAFASEHIVTDLVPAFVPKVNLLYKYGGKRVDLGKPILKTSQTIEAPTVVLRGIKGSSPQANYSVFLIDPDVPEEGPLGTPYLHWYYAHARTFCQMKNVVEQEVTAYEAPTPGSPTNHRYTFLVYTEPPGYTPDTVAAQARPGFNIANYIKGTGLKLVGGNFFLEAITNDVTNPPT